MNTPLHEAMMIWVLMSVSVLLVAGITYIYTNQNRKMTLIFTLASIVGIALIKLVSLVQLILESSFLGKLDENNAPYILAKPGWGLLISAWHIWIIPVIIVLIISSLIILLLFNHQHHAAEKLQVFMPMHLLPQQTSVTKISQFMTAETVQQKIKTAQDKMQETLLENASYAIKNNDLTIALHNLEDTLAKVKQEHQAKIDTLKLALSAKNQENKRLSEIILELKKSSKFFTL